ncbi:Bifunctional purine biosynthetic protein ADE1 [Venturia nashicola]|nr:Bifunctional purine biosynthetic protein ADE1 [Venturia nashicola]
MASLEPERNGFKTQDEPHPSEIAPSGAVNGQVGINEIRKAIPAYCFQPSLFWSFYYLFRDLIYSTILIRAFFSIYKYTQDGPYQYLHYPLLILQSFSQGIVWTGLWILAHECGHSAFSTNNILNDSVGFVLHSWLLAPYFSWKSTHRRHHIHANNLDKDLHYVPSTRDAYASGIGIDADGLEDLGEDAPIVLFYRIILQQAIGWNWYILSNITAPTGSLLKQGKSVWRHSHFDPWGSIFRDSEVTSVILSDIGCGLTLTFLWLLRSYLGSFEKLFWFYIVPWCWVNNWIVMITYLHHTHPTLPKYSAEQWTFIHGATATIDRNFGIIGTHFFHNISSDHVAHHLFSKIPHYYGREVTNIIKPLLGNQYHGDGGFSWSELKLAFTRCQYVEEDAEKDRDYFQSSVGKDIEGPHALWYRGGRSPKPEYRMRS